MTGWVIIGLLDIAVLLGFRRLGGIDAAAGALTAWGRSASRIDGEPATCR